MNNYSGPDKTTRSEMLLISLKLLGALAVLYVIVAIGAHFVSKGMIFPHPPLKYAKGPDYVEFKAADGTTLVGRHWVSPNSKYTLLYLHGNYEDLGSLAEYLPDFVAAGYSVFAFDYRGYGLSEGAASESNVYADAKTAYEYVRSTLGVPPERIVLFGYSLGGGPAIELARQEPIAGLVLQGTFVSTYRVMTRVPLFPWDKFRNLAKVSKLTCPIMVIHGTADATVPFWHGEAIYQAITARKTKLFVEGGGHGGLAKFVGPLYWQELRRFTDSL